MVRSMMCTSGLPRFLWGEALKTANYITNRTPSKAVAKTSFELWKNRKPSVHHVHVWGCKAEARPYNPQEGKLDPKTISAHFIGYPENSRGYRFYCPSHTTRIIETNKAIFLDEINYSHSYENLELEFQELPEDESENIGIPITFETAAGDIEQPQLEVVAENQNNNFENVVGELDEVEQEPEPQNLQEAQVDPEAAPQQLRRSGRIRKPAINPQEYMVYLQEAEFDWGEDNDPENFSQAINSDQSLKWTEAMEAELQSMYDNNVWELVEPTGSHKPIGCKWVFKTKRCADGSVERFKARLVAKGFTQQE
ncbi:putative RNA-directed DNA polymerase [Rosa chinensis]|uniref:Putative RNA-directed DNA polymerase n=3 Tax=Rosa chinensis TaxID=74649 RepID=A0A2P6SPP8_ROSCH|nr:putative RNA-directed DNA polymerase [Rosa chinensis]